MSVTPERTVQAGTDELERLLEGVAGLSEVASGLAAPASFKVSLRTILQLLHETFGLAQSALFQYQAESDRLTMAASLGVQRAPSLLVPTAEALAFWSATGIRREAAIGGDGLRSQRALASFFQANETARLPGHCWVPLAVNGGFHGLLMLGEKQGGVPLLPVDLELLLVIARQLAWALHHHAMKFQLDLKILELSRLQEISLALHASLNRDHIVRDLVPQAAELIKARRGALYELDGEDLVVAAAFEHADLLGKREPLAGHWLEHALRGAEPVRYASPDIPPALGARSALAVAISVRGYVAGLLCLMDKEQGMGLTSFNTADAELLSALAVQAAASMENARLYEMATVDGLTRLYLRRHFEQRLAEEARRSQRYGTPLSLMMLDIDHFKRFNDTYGHATGDDVLRLVAQVIRRNIREDLDLPARYGGEEMLVLMPETDPEGAFRLAERVRQAVETASLPGPGGVPLSVTVSVGVATIPTHAQVEQALLETADAALYESKRAGRNRVTLAPVPRSL